MSHIIECRGVGRVYRSSVKGDGFKEAMKLLFNPQFKETTALENISFTIREGEFVGLIGANGAGKTTLLKILSGLIPASTGEAKVLGIDPFQRTMEFRKSIALVMGQKAQLWWDLPATDAFDLIREIYEIPEPTYRARLSELAKILDVETHLGTQIRRLSLGERMKMELIGAILHWPKIIFLDEPTIGLDVLAAQKLREFLAEFNRKEKATIILTSHNMDDIEQLCPRIILIKEGKILLDGSPKSLTSESEKRVRVRIFPDPTISEISNLTGVSESLIEHDESFFLTVASAKVPEILTKLLSKFRITDMGIEEPSLERVIKRVYANES